MLFNFDEPEGTQGDGPPSRASDSSSVVEPTSGAPLRTPWLFAALGLLTGLALGVGMWLLWPNSTDQLTQAQVDVAIEEALASQAEQPAIASDVFAQIAPSLVIVRTDTDGEASGIGGGVVINDQGQILTANHVISNATAIELIFGDGSRAPAQIVSSEPENDIAVLEAVGSTGPLTPAVMGNSRTLQIGDPVFAVGNPLGLAGSMSAGVISGLDRDVPFPSDPEATDDPEDTGNPDAELTLEGLIQFDAAVNQGNSGGPLLNSQGQVIGIVTALADPSQQGFFIGIGFAVPIDIAAAGGANGPSQ